MLATEMINTESRNHVKKDKKNGKKKLPNVVLLAGLMVRPGRRKYFSPGAIAGRGKGGARPGVCTININEKKGVRP
jgi:hypothetical protein